jgi:hypothetical protein
MLLIHGFVPTVEEAAARIDAVGRADVLAHGERLAGQARAALALYGPVAGAPSLDDLRRRLAA